MAIRYRDDERVIALSVRDLVESGPPSGHLVVDLVQSKMLRMAQGRKVHAAWQDAMVQQDEHYTPEVRVEAKVAVGAWTVVLTGRVDGLIDHEGRTVVEEIKSTALDAGRLYDTAVDDWPAYVAQLELYLWMLAESGRIDPSGRLVLISVSDASRHVLGVPLDHGRLTAFVHDRAAHLVRQRERRLAWYATRRASEVPWPFPEWRPGQVQIATATHDSLDTGKRALIQAPTGLGKTAAVLHGALRYARAHDKQVFWATSRNTQQASVIATLERFRAAGLSLRWVALRAKAKVCLQEVVSCRPDTCPYARDYYDKRRDSEVVERAVDRGSMTPDQAMDLGREAGICPSELLLDTSEHVDVVVGDINYVLAPQGRIRRHFGERPARDWVVVADEAHQLVERVRGYRSPRIEVRQVRAAKRALVRRDPDTFGPYVELCDDIHDVVLEAVRTAQPPYQDQEALAAIRIDPWRTLSARLDAVGLDYALLTARAPASGAPGEDPWLDLARSVLRFAEAVEVAGDETVSLARVTSGDESIRLLCLDPSSWLRPHLRTLDGFVGCSATLTPLAFHRDLLGLPADLTWVDVPPPFPPERLLVTVAPRVSTAWRDREAHAPRTAALIQQCAEAVPGNVAVYFPSFAMLRDITARWTFEDRDVLAQEPGMTDSLRASWLRRLGEPGRPTVLAAVLGGVFAEGVDLPPGALSGVLIAGPALPPIGLERDLLREHYEERYQAGFAYASLVPGITKVVQAAGRLIRRDEDRGVLILLGKRFRWRDYAALLPEWWQADTPDDPVAAVKRFWEADT